MNVQEFIDNYRNHPVLFIGTGLSLRYLENSYSWDGLLKSISYELKGNDEFYFDIKSRCEIEGKYDYSKVAGLLEEEFNQTLLNDRNGKFKEVNDLFYEEMSKDRSISRFKIYVASLLEKLDIKEEKQDEIAELKKARKNVGSVITTNYDLFIESVFDFHPLIGNNILLSNPYGSVYKIHGCASNPLKIIITDKDYSNFNQKYELIRAQLLSIFIHNPIIFLGYSIGDENIKSLLKTIFTYVEPNSKEAKKIRDNFLLIEYEQDSFSTEVLEHDIDIEGFSTIRINKIKTDNFVEVYRGLSNLTLPISAMDVRKVQSIVKEIYSGGSIKVNITEDLEALSNSDKIIAIGSSKTITYHFQTAPELIANYFSVMDESNYQLIKLINKYTIQTSQWFPIFGFYSICQEVNEASRLKIQQESKINTLIKSMPSACKKNHNSIDSIFEDSKITASNRNNAIFFSVATKVIGVEEIESYLRNYEDKNCTDYRKLLCVFDFVKYGGVGD